VTNRSRSGHPLFHPPLPVCGCAHAATSGRARHPPLMSAKRTASTAPRSARTGWAATEPTGWRRPGGRHAARLFPTQRNPGPAPRLLTRTNAQVLAMCVPQLRPHHAGRAGEHLA
jgi:hypothetical protein